MYYIIFDKENELYGDFYGSSIEEVWTPFEDYARSKGIDKSKYTIVNITKDELGIISEWFEKEYLMATVDKLIVDKKIKEK